MNKKIISFLTILMLIILSSLVFLFVQTQDSMYRAQNEAVELISHDYEIKTVNDFYWSTTDQTYFTLDFTDEEGTRRYGFIEQEGGKTTYATSNEIINEDEATSIVLNDMTPDKIIQMRLALIDQQPVWEGTIQNNDQTITYYIISATDGSWIQTIENI